jgi:hypothetical protein
MEIFGIGTHRRSKRTLEEQVGGQRIFIGGGSGGGGGHTVEDVTANFLFVPLPIATTECNSYPIQTSHYPIAYTQGRTQISIFAQYKTKDGREGYFCMGQTSMVSNGNHDNPFRDDQNRLTDVLVDAPFPKLDAYGSLGLTSHIGYMNPPETAKRQMGMMYRESDNTYGVFPTASGNWNVGHSQPQGKPTLLLWTYNAQYNSQIGRIQYINRRYKIVDRFGGVLMLTKWWGAQVDSGNYRRMQITGADNPGAGIGNGLEYMFQDYTLFNDEYFNVLGKQSYNLYWAFYTDGPLEGEEWPIMPDSGGAIRPIASHMEDFGFTAL